MRVYVPATLPALHHLVDAGTLPTGSRGYAVTAAVRRADPEGDVEEWEFAAFAEAAAACVALLASSQGPRRRVVVAVDLDDSAVREVPTDRASSAVALPPQVPVAAVASVHLDSPGAEPMVSAVVDGGPLALLDDVALEWYDPSEIDGLVR